MLTSEFLKSLQRQSAAMGRHDRPLSTIKIVVHDRNGILVAHYEQVLDSYVRGLFDLLYKTFGSVYLGTPPASTVTDTGNTLRTIAGNPSVQQFITLLAGSGLATYGIVVGTSTTAPTISDYALGTLIANGTGSGQLSYGAMSVNAPVIVGSASQITCARTFTNNSGASITINEVGAYASFIDSGSAQRYAMILHDLVSPGVTVLNGATATATYTLSVSV